MLSPIADIRNEATAMLEKEQQQKVRSNVAYRLFEGLQYVCPYGCPEPVLTNDCFFVESPEPVLLKSPCSYTND
jgi:hypothetical protein